MKKNNWLLFSFFLAIGLIWGFIYWLVIVPGS
ncbi:hypothetical protein B14911_08682 [Bacillus sp. NRRL B-14911]|uniref:Uncharacterized protein n=1 Tax=Bacillus infantis NRRL B-14911 TaxID=1367477 RepID=U5LD91_9BACI|nr:hypothetical protein N288_17390 [Bacillus infantis NRRL B-14911]EAR65314.1 hypothetical protein B14911_08682 [Bacillus sp. NRRL B-14911]